MNYSEIKRLDIANGVGVRVSVFVSGCTRRCEGCFNEATWDFDAGSEFGPDVMLDVMRSLGDPMVDGLSVLGGEPLEPRNQPGVLRLLASAREWHPDKSVWMWTGYTFEELVSCRSGAGDVRTILGLVDVLVDGPFVVGKRDLTLRFRGSGNQRILDVRKSMEAGVPVEWTDGPTLSTRRWT